MDKILIGVLVGFSVGTLTGTGYGMLGSLTIKKEQFCEWYVKQTISDCYNLKYSPEDRQKCIESIPTGYLKCTNKF